ncbi:MAG: stage III sporulation protein AB [Clostridia bacterium]|nr:stage III sporulation protein AB [Clostridia bacterium]
MYLLKCILLITLFCTSTIIGILISKRYSNRLKILRDLKNALNIFEVKINFSFETISEIFMEISQKINGVAGKIFFDTVKNIENNMCAGDAWEKSIDKNKDVLKKDDIDCLKTLGKLLGKTDIEGQLNQIELVSTFLEKQINDANEDKNKNEKMYKKLGAIVGLVIVIVLI